jgi:S1-C subfamily serine protease
MIRKRSVFALAKALDGVPVLGTLAGTPAAKAGIRYGDVLLSVNGMRTRTVADYIEAKALREDGMEVVVFRAGVEHQNDLAYEERVQIDPQKLISELMTLRIGVEDDSDDPTGTA